MNYGVCQEQRLGIGDWTQSRRVEAQARTVELMWRDGRADLATQDLGADYTLGALFINGDPLGSRWKMPCARRSPEADGYGRTA